MKQMPQIILIPICMVLGVVIGSALPVNGKRNDLIVAVLRFLSSFK